MRVLRTSLIAAAMLASVMAAAQAQPAPSWTSIDQALGRSGTTQPDGVRRYSFPRSDLKVEVDGVAIKPALALGGWLAFEPMHRNGRGMVMGDLVLTQDEVNPVMNELLKEGLTITAVHNHLLRSSPVTMYMHVRGEGDLGRLAASFHSALALSHTPLQPPSPAAAAPALELDTAAIDRIMGRQGKANGGVYQFTVPRREAITDGGMNVGASMGTGTSINFQPTAGGKAAVTGDFVLLAKEVDPVMRTLRGSGIEVTALHSHMLSEQPKLYFMHFWAVADARQLATGLRSALDKMNVR
ncbi:MAG: DUF1259 domain-containing protein [Sphingomicrobium sp.]